MYRLNNTLYPHLLFLIQVIPHLPPPQELLVACGLILPIIMGHFIGPRLSMRLCDTVLPHSKFQVSAHSIRTSQRMYLFWTCGLSLIFHFTSSSPYLLLMSFALVAPTIGGFQQTTRTFTLPKTQKYLKWTLVHISHFASLSALAHPYFRYRQSVHFCWKRLCWICGRQASTFFRHSWYISPLVIPYSHYLHFYTKSLREIEN